jgi:hypothetical protein
LSDRYAQAWTAARPYMRARKNDVHIPLSFWYAERLLELHPEADADVVLLAIMFHDTGWAVIDEERIFREGFATGDQEVDLSSDVRILHEKEGARLAAEALGEEWDPAVVEEVVAIIDGHDSRLQALSRNDELVKDADKLWRYTESAVRICHRWMKLTTDAYIEWVGSEIDAWFFTDAARGLARRELAHSRDALAAQPVA